MNLRQTFTALVILSFILSASFAAYLLVKETRRPKLPILGQIQKFSLTDANGNAFSSQQLNGKIWVADFFFTTCGDICPMMTKHMAGLNEALKPIKDVSLVSFTVNPENDSPDILKKYAEENNLDTKRWYFLTGTREDLTKIMAESFKLGSTDEPIFHSSYFTLVDRYGYVRGYYDGIKKEAMNKLLIDASNLAKDRNGRPSNLAHY